MSDLDDIEDEEAKKEKKEFVNGYAGYLEDVEGLSEDAAKAHAGYEASKINFADRSPPSRYDELRAAGYKKRDIPVADLLSKFKDTGSNVMADFKYLPKKEFIKRYGKQVYQNLLGFTPAQAARATKTFAKDTAKVGSALLLNARQEGLRQTPVGSATATTVPQTVVQAPPTAPLSEPQEETMAQLNEKTVLKDSIKSSDERPDNILILDALKAFIDSLPDEYEIDVAIPSSTALQLRRVNGVDILINRALERLSGGSRKKRSRILEVLETERYGTMWGLKSFIEDNPEFERIIEASTNPLSHELLGVKEQSDLEWQPEDSEVELRQLVSGDMLATGNRLAALLEESTPSQPVCPSCGFIECICQKATQLPSTPVGRVKQHLKKSPTHDLVIVPETDEERAEVGDYDNESE